MSKQQSVYAFMLVVMFLSMVAEYIMNGGDVARFRHNYKLWGKRIETWMIDVGAGNLWEDDDE